MNEPIVTVLMPVYNGSLFLKEAIDSVLAQTFTDFELLIINDGSTDNSEEMIAAYDDGRIRHIKNEVNAGLVQTLNRGIKLAAGRYIARMDADDICLPNRLQLQAAYLDANEKASFVASTITIIDENGHESGAWQLDRQTTTPAAIANAIIYKNCIAHPTVMGRKNAFQQLGYKEHQKHVEDYDLWLRALSAGFVIHKIAKPLLLYRQHSASVTNTQLRKNFSVMHWRMKRKFLAAELKNGRLSAFALKIFFTMLLDGATALYKKAKQSAKA